MGEDYILKFFVFSIFSDKKVGERRNTFITHIENYSSIRMESPKHFNGFIKTLSVDAYEFLKGC